MKRGIALRRGDAAGRLHAGPAARPDRGAGAPRPAAPDRRPAPGPSGRGRRAGAVADQDRSRWDRAKIADGHRPARQRRSSPPTVWPTRTSCRWPSPVFATMAWSSTFGGDGLDGDLGAALRDPRRHPPEPDGRHQRRRRPRTRLDDPPTPASSALDRVPGSAPRPRRRGRPAARCSSRPGRPEEAHDAFSRGPPRSPRASRQQRHLAGGPPLQVDDRAGEGAGDAVNPPAPPPTTIFPQSSTVSASARAITS